MTNLTLNPLFNLDDMITRIGKENGQHSHPLVGQDILSVAQFSTDTLEYIFARAHEMREMVQKVGAAMAELNNISRVEVEQAVYGFIDEAGDLTGLGVGNDQYIRKMLVSALGEDKAKSLADRILIGGNTSGLDTLKWMDARSVAGMIRYEHPQIQAIVVAYLDGDHAAEVLSNFAPQVRLDVMMRVARLVKFSKRT